MATVVALLFLNFVDEHFNQARYTKAATAMLSHMTKSFGTRSFSQQGRRAFRLSDLPWICA